MTIKIFFTALIALIAVVIFAKATHDPIQALRYSYAKENETKNILIGLVLFSCLVVMFFSGIIIVWSML